MSLEMSLGAGTLPRSTSTIINKALVACEMTGTAPHHVIEVREVDTTGTRSVSTTEMKVDTTAKMALEAAATSAAEQLTSIDAQLLINNENLEEIRPPLQKRNRYATFSCALTSLACATGLIYGAVQSCRESCSISSTILTSSLLEIGGIIAGAYVATLVACCCNPLLEKRRRLNNQNLSLNCEKNILVACIKDRFFLECAYCLYATKAQADQFDEQFTFVKFLEEEENRIDVYNYVSQKRALNREEIHKQNEQKYLTATSYQTI